MVTQKLLWLFKAVSVWLWLQQYPLSRGELLIYAGDVTVWGRLSFSAESEETAREASSCLPGLNLDILPSKRTADSYCCLNGALQQMLRHWKWAAVYFWTLITNTHHERSREYTFKVHAFVEHVTRFSWGRCICWEKKRSIFASSNSSKTKSGISPR